MTWITRLPSIFRALSPSLVLVSSVVILTEHGHLASEYSLVLFQKTPGRQQGWMMPGATARKFMLHYFILRVARFAAPGAAGAAARLGKPLPHPTVVAPGAAASVHRLRADGAVAALVGDLSPVPTRGRRGAGGAAARSGSAAAPGAAGAAAP
ncbi:hypothetical protein THAOC_23369, partial [Thalassiosira oceanica]